ncbi:MAG: CAP domain-containing protein [Bacteroidia bacterium]
MAFKVVIFYSLLVSNYFLGLTFAKTKEPSNTVTKLGKHMGSQSHITGDIENELVKLKKLLKEKSYSAFSQLMQRSLQAHPNHTELLKLKKQFVIDDYKNEFLQSSSASTNYFIKPPSIGKCFEGKLSNEAYNKVLSRINYLRRLAGVNDSCSFNEIFNSHCQSAALMMEANDALDHFPKSNWKCYTKNGASVAGKSNLSLGNGFEDALMSQMKDDGQSNFACGHRRWILNPENLVFGFGSTKQAMCLKVIGDLKGKVDVKSESINGIAWPSKDFFPIDLLPTRWSYSLKLADFSKAKVTVMSEGKSLSVKTEKLAVGYALNTLVWKLNTTLVDANKTFQVSIGNVYVNKKKIPNISYTISFVDVK